MIRYSILGLFIAALVAYSWKDWFRALCLLIMVVAVLERPDMPKSMLGIQGLNPFNVGLAGIVLAWALTRSRETLEKNAPPLFNLMLSLLAGVMLIGFLRLLVEPSNLVATGVGLNPTRYTTFGLVAEFLLNTFKWVVPGLLLFKGCRSKEHHQWAVLCLTGLYLILAAQTIRQMPLPLLLDGDALSRRAGRVLAIRVGYHRVELAGMFAGASWAMLTVRPLFTSLLARVGLLGMAGITTLALALTGGRTGYGAWCIVGILLAGLRWRRALLLGPIAVSLLIGSAPGISQRLLQGITYDESGEAITAGKTDIYTVTSGRSVLWPYVLESIAEHPVFGYGREAINRNGLREKAFQGTGEDFGHPHNGYFQFALDNGLVGLMVFLMFFVMLLRESVALFRRDDPQATAAGGMAFALVTSFLIAAVGAQTFYPTELSMGVWCAIGLMMRVSLQQSGLYSAPEAIPDHRVTWKTKARRLRWAVTRLGRAPKVEPGHPNPATNRTLALPSHRTALSSATGRLRVRWKPNHTR